MPITRTGEVLVKQAGIWPKGLSEAAKQFRKAMPGKDEIAGAADRFGTGKLLRKGWLFNSPLWKSLKPTARAVGKGTVEAGKLLGKGSVAAAKGTATLTKKYPGVMLPALVTAGVAGYNLPGSARRNMLHVNPDANFTTQGFRGIRYHSPDHEAMAQSMNVFV